VVNDVTSSKDLPKELKAAAGTGATDPVAALLCQAEQGTRLFDYLPGCLFYVKDRDGRFLDANPALLRMFGLNSKEELIGKQDVDFIPRYLVETYQQDDQRVLLKGEVLHDKVELLTSRGGVVDWFITTKIPLRSAEGAIVALAGMTREYAGVSGGSMQHSGDLAPAVETIRSEFSGQIRIPELAASCHLSVSAFERRFKKQFRLSPTEYIRKVRAHEACRKLLHGRNSLAEIAFDCGFSDQSHFTREFQRVMGASPGVYRKSHGEIKLD
jgi:PAS domain S-box-containing protein